MFEVNRDRESRIHSDAVFFEIAGRIAHQESLVSYPIVFEDEKIITRRLFKGDDSYSAIPGVAFYLDYQDKKDKKPDTLSGKLLFEYGAHPVVDAGRVIVAQMHFEVHPKNEFRFFHRYVTPDVRKEGIGTRLFHLAEEWFLKVAQESRSPVCLSLQVGQQSVIHWAEKMGFSVEDDQQELLQELREHPERFFEDEVIVSEESQAQGIVKAKYTFRVGTKGRYMEDAVRLTFQKWVKPATEDSSVDVEAPSE